MVSLVGKMVKSNDRVGLIVKEQEVKTVGEGQPYHTFAIQAVMQDNQERLVFLVPNEKYDGSRGEVSNLGGYDIEIF